MRILDGVRFSEGIVEYPYDDDGGVDEYIDADETVETELPTTTIGMEKTTENEEEPDDPSSKKWVLPTVISASVVIVVVLVVVGVVVYRKYKCFGLWSRRIIQKAQPVLSRLSSAGSSRASIASSSILGGVGRRRYKKYLMRLGDEGFDNVISGRDLTSEFQALKREDPKELSVCVALLPQNLQRNRFSNVLPYDRNRVLLGNKNAKEEGEDDHDGWEWNDYINASYLSSPTNSNEFICTQAPRQNTVDHFWAMCWESGADAIVMLTRCYENNKEKCFPYWPSSLIGSSSSRSSEIKVHLEKLFAYRLGEGSVDDTQQQHLWLVSELRMEKGEETRPITHFVFLSWPDFGVVDPPNALLSFLNHFRKVVVRRKESKGDGTGATTIVHCSAGVGRTGVFIAVDNIMSQLATANDEESKGSRMVNVFQVVQQMRMERMGMVQTLEQYKLIYKCLALIAKNEPIPEPTQVSPDDIKMLDWGLPD